MELYDSARAEIVFVTGQEDSFSTEDLSPLQTVLEYELAIALSPARMGECRSLYALQFEAGARLVYNVR